MSDDKIYKITFSQNKSIIESKFEDVEKFEEENEPLLRAMKENSFPFVISISPDPLSVTAYSTSFARIYFIESVFNFGVFHNQPGALDTWVKYMNNLYKDRIKLDAMGLGDKI